MLADFRLALRSLVARPAFTAVAVLALALGTGANTLVFSVANAVLLRALPFADPERLYVVSARAAEPESKDEGLSWPDVRDLRAAAPSFDGLAAIGFGSFDLTGTAEPNQVRAGLATDGLFRVLGLRPLVGRAIADEEIRTGAPVVALDEELWRSQFNADPNVVGRSITLDGAPYTVVGVLPHVRLRYNEYELWATAPPKEVAAAKRDARELTAVGRLRPGASAAAAQRELDAAARTLAAQYPTENGGYRYRAVPLREWIAGTMRPALLVLMGAVALVLLIACTNVAHMLLARASQREREVAVRTALGATRPRIVRQLLTESLALALLGSAAGVALAYLLLPGLLRLSPLDAAERAAVSVDGRVLLASLAVAGLAAALFGLWPALVATRVDLQHSLKGDGARGATSRGGWRTRGLLVVSEIALASVLLVGAGLLLKSFGRLTRVERGYDPTLTVSRGLVLPENLYPKAADKREFMRRVFERLRATPGVEVAAATNFPPSQGAPASEIQVVGRANDGPPSARQATWRVITPDYFRALRVPVLRGRAFDESDTPAGAKVAVINQALAQRYFPGEDPIGREIRLIPFGPPVVARVVGVTGDVRHGGRTQAVEPDLYLPFAQNSWGYMNLLVRGRRTTPAALQVAINRAVLAVDPARPTFNPTTLAERAEGDLAEPRFGATLLSLFAGVAALLACVGVFGVMAYAVAARTRELGIRVALGGQPRQVMRHVLRPGLALVGLGAAGGVLGALAAGRVLASQLYGVSPSDPLVLLAAAATIALVGAVACYVPARRATRVDPMTALRSE